ncbi:Hypothetical protein MVR_LOCUS417 [uncultured virus]|nr:Hypothetical protein MVR_LOCUS417 [uncultured virus]
MSNTNFLHHYTIMQDTTPLPKFILTHIITYCDIKALALLASSSKSMYNTINAISKQFCMEIQPHVFNQIPHLNINWVYVHYCLLYKITKITKHSSYGHIIYDCNFILGHIDNSKLVGLSILHFKGRTIARYHDASMQDHEDWNNLFHYHGQFSYYTNKIHDISNTFTGDDMRMRIDIMRRFMTDALFELLRKQTGKQVNS